MMTTSLFSRSLVTLMNEQVSLIGDFFVHGVRETSFQVLQLFFVSGIMNLYLRRPFSGRTVFCSASGLSPQPAHSKSLRQVVSDSLHFCRLFLSHGPGYMCVVFMITQCCSFTKQFPLVTECSLPSFRRVNVEKERKKKNVEYFCHLYTPLPFSSEDFFAWRASEIQLREERRSCSAAG